MPRTFILAIALVSLPMFAQVVPCESVGGEYRECRVGSSGKIRLVFEMSEQGCREGVTWGTRSAGVVWVTRGCRGRFGVDAPAGGRTLCESTQGDRVYCNANTSRGVFLLRQLSSAACILGETWGFDDAEDRIWVNRGCRAEFSLGRSAFAPRVQQTLDAPVVCESTNGRRKQCPADTSAGVQIVRSLDDRRCRFDHDWGYDETGIWVNHGCRAELVVRDKSKPILQTVACESSGGDRRVLCAADTTYGVALVRFLADEECTLDKTWGFDDEGVWVSHGCQAQFALGGYRLPPEAVPATALNVVCESSGGQRQDCDIEITRGVGLVRQLGQSPCVLNRTWGYDRIGIWVTEDCRAEFAVAR